MHVVLLGFRNFKAASLHFAAATPTKAQRQKKVIFNNLLFFSVISGKQGECTEHNSACGLKQTLVIESASNVTVQTTPVHKTSAFLSKGHPQQAASLFYNNPTHSDSSLKKKTVLGACHGESEVPWRTFFCSKSSKSISLNELKRMWGHISLRLLSNK